MRPANLEDPRESVTVSVREDATTTMLSVAPRVQHNYHRELLDYISPMYFSRIFRNY